MKNKTFNITMIIIMSVLVIYYIKVYPDLPERIPMNIGVNGNVTSWGSRSSIFIFAGIAPLILISYKIYAYFADRLQEIVDNRADERIILFLIILLFTYIAILYTEMIKTLDGDRVNSAFFMEGIMIGLGILMIGIGNYMPRIEKNRTIGIRVRWTLNNQGVWDRTHRLAGITSVIAGIMTILLTLLGIPYYWLWSVIAMILGLAVLPVVYAYKASK